MTSESDGNGTAGPRAGRREWIGLAVLALPMLLVSMDLSVLHLAAPQLSSDLRPSSSQLLWIIDVYGFVLSGFLITMGTLGDRIGRRKLLLLGAAAFGAASIVAAFSVSAEMLIASRALLGVAGATLAPSTLALISNMFHDPQQRTAAVSTWFMSFLAGIAIGPLVGGVLLEFFWWGSVFLISVPVMVLLLVVGPILLPEYRDRRVGRLDLASATMLLVAVLAVIYGLKQVAQDGLAVLPVLAIVVGLGVGVVFVRRQRTLSDPLIDLELFGERTFGVSLGALTVTGVVIGGLTYLAAQFLQLVLGLSPLQAGLWMLCPLGVGIVAIFAASAIVRWIRPGLVVAGGLAVGAVGYAVVSQATTSSGVAVLVTGLTIAFAGLMPVGALGTDIVLGAAPPERAGAASAISETTQELGQALGVALLGSVSTAVYRSQVTSAVPTSAPPDAAEAARGTLGGATEVADQLPAGLLATAEEAFTDGMQWAAGLSAVALALFAAVAAVVLGRMPATAPPVDDSRTVAPRST